MQDISQIERQLFILSRLSANKKGCTLHEIGNYLKSMSIEVSKKTILRDIDSLSVSGFPIIEEKRGRNTFFYSEKFGLDSISFTISELISLYFIKELLKSYSMLDVGMNAFNLIDRMVSHLPKVNQEFIDTLKELFKVHPLDVISEKAINPEFLNLIQNASAQNKKLRINYTSFNKEEKTDRVIDPYFLEIHEGCYHLIGYCYLRNSIREFRVSRINSLKVLEETFTKPLDFYEKYQKDKFSKLTGDRKITLKLLFTGNAARYVKEYESDKADTVKDDGNGGLLFVRETTKTPEIVRWILGFGGEVEVLEPEELKEEVIQTAEDILKKYKELS